MKQTQPTSEPTEAQIVASLLQQTGKSMIKAQAKSATVRFPLHQLCTLDAMAKMANKSRSAMIFYIVEIGLEQVMNATNDKTKKQLAAFASEFMAEYSDQDLETLSD